LVTDLIDFSDHPMVDNNAEKISALKDIIRRQGDNLLLILRGRGYASFVSDIIYVVLVSQRIEDTEESFEELFSPFGKIRISIVPEEGFLASLIINDIDDIFYTKKHGFLFLEEEKKKNIDVENIKQWTENFGQMPNWQYTPPSTDTNDTYTFGIDLGGTGTAQTITATNNTATTTGTVWIDTNVNNQVIDGGHHGPRAVDIHVDGNVNGIHMMNNNQEWVHMENVGSDL